MIWLILELRCVFVSNVKNPKEKWVNSWSYP